MDTLRLPRRAKPKRKRHEVIDTSSACGSEYLCNTCGHVGAVEDYSRLAAAMERHAIYG